jgi:hypothetical protein
LCVDSIAKEIEDYKAAQVRSVAGQLRLPFELKELRGHAERSVEKARETYDGKSGHVTWLQHVKRHIYTAVIDGGNEEKAKTGTRPAPKDERIREALETFSDPQTNPKNWEWNWKHLLEECEYEEVRALENYLDAKRDELERSLGNKALEHIEVCARNRRFVLMLGKEGVKCIDISALYWAAVFWRRAREENVSGVKPDPQHSHTVPERGRYRRIAEALSQHGEKVTDKKVKTWLDRMREHPEIKDWLDRWGPEPAIEFEGGLNGFLLYIADPRAWRRRQRRLNR